MEVTRRESVAVGMEIDHVNAIPRLPVLAGLSGAQIERGNPGLMSDRDSPAVGTESQRKTFFGRMVENRFTTLPPPQSQLAVLGDIGDEAAIRAEREMDSARAGCGLQTLQFAVVRNGANADYAVLVDTGIALLKRVGHNGSGFRI